MPIIVRPSEAEAAAAAGSEVAAAERRLAAHMLNMEAGALAWAPGPDADTPLVPAPAPHAPWPVIELPALTAAGRPRRVHYRPAAGVVYAGEAPALARRLAAILAPHTAHLRGPRAVAAGGMSVVSTERGRETVSAETAVIGPRPLYRRPLPAGPARAARPARLLHIADTVGYETEPPMYSVRAAFTWIFLPLGAAMLISATPHADSVAAAAAANALAAGIVYDRRRVLVCADGAAPATITASDVAGRAPPAGWALPAALPRAIARGRGSESDQLPLPAALAGLGRCYALRVTVLANTNANANATATANANAVEATEAAATEAAFTGAAVAAATAAAREAIALALASAAGAAPTYCGALPVAPPPGTPVRLSFVGNYYTLARRAGALADAAATFAALPAGEWPGSSSRQNSSSSLVSSSNSNATYVVGCAGKARASRCAVCLAPAAGPVALVAGARCPKAGRALAADYRRDARLADHRGDRLVAVSDLDSGDLLRPPQTDASTQASQAQPAALICYDCWGSLETATDPTERGAARLAEALRGQVSRVVVPWSQAEAAAACGLDGLGRLLAGEARTTAVPGAIAVTVTLPDASKCTFILAGMSLGPWPALDHALPGGVVVPGLNLVQVQE